MGATLEPAEIGGAKHAGTLSDEFVALTAKNTMKWYPIRTFAACSTSTAPTPTP